MKTFYIYKNILVGILLWMMIENVKSVENKVMFRNGYRENVELRQKLNLYKGKGVLYGNAVNLPESFDARVQRPSCIGPILNQGGCGSCWAFGCGESLSDRFCIHSNGTQSVSLSIQEILSCADEDIWHRII